MPNYNETESPPSKEDFLFGGKVALRLQSVDDKYVWGPDRQSAKFKVIGNGVPILLAEAVAKELYKVIVDNTRR